MAESIERVAGSIRKVAESIGKPAFPMAIEEEAAADRETIALIIAPAYVGSCVTAPGLPYFVTVGSFALLGADSSDLLLIM